MKRFLSLLTLLICGVAHAQVVPSAPAGTLQGVPSGSGPAAPGPITVGSNLSFSGSTLNAAAGAVPGYFYPATADSTGIAAAALQAYNAGGGTVVIDNCTYAGQFSLNGSIPTLTVTGSSGQPLCPALFATQPIWSTGVLSFNGAANPITITSVNGGGVYAISAAGPGGAGTISSAAGTATSGTYTGVALFTTSGSYGNGAIATVVVSGGSVSSITITTPGIGYNAGDTFSFTITGGSGTGTIATTTPVSQQITAGLFLSAPLPRYPGVYYAGVGWAYGAAGSALQFQGTTLYGNGTYDAIDYNNIDGSTLPTNNSSFVASSVQGGGAHDLNFYNFKNSIKSGSLYNAGDMSAHYWNLSTFGATGWCYWFENFNASVTWDHIHGASCVNGQIMFRSSGGLAEQNGNSKAHDLTAIAYPNARSRGIVDTAIGAGSAMNSFNIDQVLATGESHATTTETATMASASATITLGAGGSLFAAYEPVQVSGTLTNSPFLSNTTYYVVPGSVSGNTLQLSYYAGGAALLSTGAVAGMSVTTSGFPPMEVYGDFNGQSAKNSSVSSILPGNFYDIDLENNGGTGSGAIFIQNVRDASFHFNIAIPGNIGTCITRSVNNVTLYTIADEPFTCETASDFAVPTIFGPVSSVYSQNPAASVGAPVSVGFEVLNAAYADSRCKSGGGMVSLSGVNAPDLCFNKNGAFADFFNHAFGSQTTQVAGGASIPYPGTTSLVTCTSAGSIALPAITNIAGDGLWLLVNNPTGGTCTLTSALTIYGSGTSGNSIGIPSQSSALLNLSNFSGTLIWTMLGYSPAGLPGGGSSGQALVLNSGLVPTWTSLTGTGTVTTTGTPTNGNLSCFSGSTSIANCTNQIGTSGAVIPLLNSANTWSASQTLNQFAWSGNASYAGGVVNGVGMSSTSAPTYTDTSSAGGTIANAYMFNFPAPALAASAATTYSNVWTVHIPNATCGTNATCTAISGLLVDGFGQFSGGETVNGTVKLNTAGSSSITIGNSSHTGLTTVANLAASTPGNEFVCGTTAGVLSASTTPCVTGAASQLSVPTGTATFVGGSGVTSVACASGYLCNNTRGTLTIVGGTATTGTIATVSFSAALSAAPACFSTMNGGTAFFGIGTSAPTTTAFNITAAISVIGTTFNVDYRCMP
jgi:hypothetical protein